MITNHFNTLFFLCALSGIFLVLGHVLGGSAGLTYALIFALIGNAFTYWYSATIVLRLYNAQPLDEKKHKKIYATLSQLAEHAKTPTPKLYIVHSKMANAFATGRSPATGIIVLTDGIIELLDDHELRGVLAHELSHITNYDMLVNTMAVVMATSISYLADMIRWGLFWSHRGRKDNGYSQGAGALLLSILMPLVATMIQLALSRTREYLADETGAHCSGDPLALASALEKIEAHAKGNPLQAPTTAHATVASLFFVYPFTLQGLTHLFSTHPPIPYRVARLRKMALK